MVEKDNISDAEMACPIKKIEVIRQTYKLITIF